MSPWRDKFAGNRLKNFIRCAAAEQIMFTDTQITADNRFLEFNTGDWFTMLSGLTLIGLLAVFLT